MIISSLIFEWKANEKHSLRKKRTRPVEMFAFVVQWHDVRVYRSDDAFLLLLRVCLVYIKRKTDVATGFLAFFFFFSDVCTEEKGGKTTDELWCVKNVSRSICFSFEKEGGRHPLHRTNKDGQTRYVNESSKLSTHDSNDLRIRDDRLLSYLSLNFRLLNKKA